MAEPSGIFDSGFLVALEVFVKVHHIPYPKLPPQGIYFEALVEESFRKIKKPFTEVKPGGKNQPTHDLLVDGRRLSLKTETGDATKPDRITITKLCTTEKPPWEIESLVNRVLDHLSRYDIILMLRSIWDKAQPIIHYQLLEIATDNLRLIESAKFSPAGKGASLSANIMRDGEVLFTAYFDSADRKCTIRNLRVSDYVILSEWDVKLPG